MSAEYGPEAREAILEGLIDGKSLRAICREAGLPTVTTVMRWLQADEAWREQYARAREAGDDAMAEDIHEIADEVGVDPQDKRVRIDARKWLLAKRQPKKYGDSTMVKHADADGEKVKLDEVGIVTRLTAILSKGMRAQDEDA
jgi:hypothetical protein